MNVYIIAYTADDIN